MTVFGTVFEKKSGAAGTGTHGRGSVPLVSKLDAIPLRHEAQTFFAAQISHQECKYWQNCCLHYLDSVFYSHITTLVFTVTTLLRH